MKRVLLASAALLAIWATTLIPAKADEILLGDPLHGTICNASGAACNANEVGGVVPGNLQPGTTFGFNSSPPGATGELWVSILVPTNELAGFALPMLNSLGVDPGTKTFTASGGGATWAQGSPDLANFVFGGSVNGSPSNPFSAFATPESLVDPAGPITGFKVFSADVGNISLPGLTGQNSLTALDFFTLTSGVPNGTAITGFMVNGTDVISTAPSGQISSVPGPIVGAGLPGLVAACLGLAGLARRRKRI